MPLHSARICIYLVALCLSLGFPLTLFAAQSVMVTTGDYQIGEEGLPIPQAASLPNAAVSGEAQVKRQLVSLYGGESGDSIPERGYMTDVVWGEKTTYQDMPGVAKTISQSRILYYSFNIGQWKRKLNTETSVLTRVFMSQPLLVFLPNKDKAGLAAQLVSTPLFKQAQALYQEHILNVAADTKLLDDVIEALGEQGVAKMTALQKQSSGQTFRAAIAEAQPQIAATLPLQGNLNFTPNNTAQFSIFKGMTVKGNGGQESPTLDFQSHSSLYYGIQELSKFRDIPERFGTQLKQHFFNLNLIEPVKGLLNTETLTGGKPTSYPLATVSPTLKNLASPQNIAIFRNNPYTGWDSPMIMNMVTVVSVTLKELIGINGLFERNAVTGVLKNVSDGYDNYKSFLNNFALGYSIAKSIYDLSCTLTESKEAICTEYATAIKSVEKLFTVIGQNGVIDSVEATLNTPVGNRAKFEPGIFCAAALSEKLFAGFTSHAVRKISTSKKSNWENIKVCVVNEIFTKPFLEKMKLLNKGLYGEISAAPYNYSKTPITLTADYFARHYKWQIDGLKVEKKYQLEQLMRQLLIPKKLSIQSLLGGAAKIMNMANKALSFWQKGGKVDLVPFMGQMTEAFMDYIQTQYSADGWKQDAIDGVMTAVYDGIKTLTPAKFVQLASNANQGAALAWDWVFDPAVVKLTMTRTDNNTLAISNTLPEMKGIRYLTLPNNGNSVLDYSGGLTHIGGVGTDKWLAVSNAPDTNHLLVYNDFTASVENQSAYLWKEDNDNVNALLKNKNIRLKWHVKRFDSSADIENIPYTQRNADNAFNGVYNNIDTVVKKGWLWWKAIINLDGSLNPLHQPAVLGDAQGKFYAIDFSAVYRTLMGDTQAYPLTHKTPGIYSDYTHIQVKLGAAETLYQNTFHMYTLPNLSKVSYDNFEHNLDISLNAHSRRYCEDEACTKNAEVQLVFHSAAWPTIGKNGLWVVWMTPDGKLVTNTAPTALGPVLGNGGSAILRQPANATGNDYVVVYEDVMNGYLTHSGKATTNVLAKALKQRLAQNPRYPVIAVKLSALTRTETSFLKLQDRDGDGVANELDDFPDNPDYAYDTDNDQMPDEWERLYGLNLFVDDSNGDLDGDGISNLDEFIKKTDPRNLSVTVTPGDKQVKLVWKQPLDIQTQSVCWASKKLIDPANCFAIRNAPTNWLENQTSPVTIKKLINGTNYYFSVVAENLTTGKIITSEVLTATPQKPFTINDTGIKTCSDWSNNGLTCPVTSFPGQDAESGRDVSQNDPSNGHAGFNFVKISATGAELPANAPSWNCVKDKVTGLMWEVKTDDGGLHDKDWRYTWYQPDASKNGGFSGYQNGGSCVGSGCDTDAYTLAVNTAGWCGFKDWRMPTVDELLGIASYNPSISDTAYFFNIQNSGYWSSSPVAYNSNYAWVGSFYNLAIGLGNKGYDPWTGEWVNLYVLLVRSGL
jgi:hypothetical protein